VGAVVKKTKVVIEIADPNFKRVFRDLVASFEKHGVSDLERLSFIVGLYNEVNLQVEEITGEKIESLEPHETEQ